MSSKTPTKQKSTSKKTPVKSANKKQQVVSPNKSNAKNVVSQSNKKNVNLVNEIKTQFLQSSQTLISAKDLIINLKQILSSEGVQLAIKQLTTLVNQFNYKKQAIQSAISKLDSQNLTGLIYLIEQMICNQQNNVDSLNLSVWIGVVSKIHPDLIIYNENLKQFVSKTSLQNSKKYEEISALRGKISLITGF